MLCSLARVWAVRNLSDGAMQGFSILLYSCCYCYFQSDYDNQSSSNDKRHHLAYFNSNYCIKVFFIIVHFTSKFYNEMWGTSQNKLHDTDKLENLDS